MKYANSEQTRKLAATRSNIGSMNFDEIGKFIGVDNNPDDCYDESGDGNNAGDGKVNNTYPDQSLRVKGNRN